MKIKILVLAFFLILICNITYVNADTLDCSNTMRRGNTGSNIKRLQRRLNNIMNCDLETDGVFGRKTYSCVVKFQKKYKLSVDGIVGKNTCGKLNKDLEYVDTNDEAEIKDGNYLIVANESKGAKIYTSDNTSSNIIKRAEFGEVFRYISGNDKWYKIEINNSYGYVKTSKIRTSFILVDISDQKLQYMKHNEVVIDTNVVTGMMGSHDTPTGYYMVRKANKQRERTLRGTNDNGSKYSSYVEYWMPFITSRGIGFHDASWRSSDEFNDSTYTYDGSHGCVNMPSNQAKKLYKAITYDEDVIIRE